MSRDLIRTVAIALQNAVDARTVEYQVRHADDARRAYEQARRSATVRFEYAENLPTEAARMIARRAVSFDFDELAELEGKLAAVEARVAAALGTQADARDFRNLRLAVEN
jgi:hypothetical protein